MGGVFAKKKFCKLEDESGCMQLLCISAVSAVSFSHAWPACFVTNVWETPGSGA